MNKEIMPSPTVSIIIVNRNGQSMLAECLESIARSKPCGAREIIVVDNGSTDSSCEYLRERMARDPELHLIKNEDNRGFAEANNQGFTWAKGAYILFLNNDVIVEPDFMTPLVNALEENKNIGAVQPMIMQHPQQELVDSVGSYFLSTGFLYHLGHNKPLQDWQKKRKTIFSMKGACMLVRKSVLDKIGVFDETYFAYNEETDLCHRMWLAGWSVEHVPESRIYHRGGATSSLMPSDFVTFHSYKNRIATFLKNFEIKTLIWLLPTHLILCAGISAVYVVQGKLSLASSIVRAVLWNVTSFGLLRRKRADIARMRKVPDAQYLALTSGRVRPSYYYHLVATSLRGYRESEYDDPPRSSPAWRLPKISKLLFVVWFALFCLSLLTYSRLFGNYFEQDEWFFFPYFQKLARHPLGPILAFLAPFRDPEFFAFHLAPVGTFLLFAETMLFRLHFATYALASITLHSINAFLVFVFVRQLSGRKYISLLAAVYFVVTSGHYQAVTWVNAHINTQMALLFSLVSLLFFIQYFRKAHMRLQVGGVIAYLAALLTKETAFFLLPTTVVIALIFFGKKQLLRLRLLYLASGGYVVFRFFTPKLLEALTDMPTFASVPAKNLDAGFSAYYGLTLVLKSITSSFFTHPFLLKATEFITEVGYPQYNAEKAVRGSNYLTFTQSAGLDIVMYFLAFMLILVFLVVLRQLRTQAQDMKTVALAVLIMITSIVPFVLLTGWLLQLFTYITTIDSRHLYVVSVGISILFAYGWFALFRFISTRSLKVVAVLVCMVGIVWVVRTHQIAIDQRLLEQSAAGADRKAIVNFWLQNKPSLGKKNVFYSESNVALYGFGEYMLPFQNNPGQVIISAYGFGYKFPAPFTEASFLAKGLTEEWYEEHDNLGMGYFLKKKSLLQAVQDHDIRPEDVIAVKYDGVAHKISNITERVREDVAAYRTLRESRSSWGVYTNDVHDIEILYPEDYQVEEVVPSSKTHLLRLRVRHTRTPLLFIELNIFEKEVSAPISDMVATVDDGTGRPIADRYTFRMKKYGLGENLTTVEHINTRYQHYFFNTNNTSELKQVTMPASKLLSEAQNKELEEIFRTWEFNN